IHRASWQRRKLAKSILAWIFRTRRLERGMTDTEFYERQAVVAEAMTWLGTPFHHHQAVKGAGVDCALFLYSVYRGVGLIPEIKIEDYSPQWHLHKDEERYMNWVLQFAARVENATFKPGDGALFRFGRAA